MSVSSGVVDALSAVGADVKSLKASVGNLPSLATTAKDSLVSAVNELKTGGTAGPIKTWASDATNVSIAATTETPLTSVSFVAKANVPYLIVASVSFLKDSSTTARREIVYLSTGTTSSAGVLETAYAASTAVASSQFGTAALNHVYTPSTAGSVTLGISAVNTTSATIVASFANIDVVELLGANFASGAPAQLVGVDAVAVVTTLPATPDANTLYITTA